MNNRIVAQFELKLKESSELLKLQNKQIKELENRLKEKSIETQNVRHLYEKEVEESTKLKESLETFKCKLNIGTERQLIGFKEENTLNSTQITRLSQQVIQLKHDFNCIQSKCCLLERNLIEKNSEIQRLNTNGLNLVSQMANIRTRADVLHNQFKSLTQNHLDLKNIVKSANDVNLELRTQINKLNGEVSAVNSENTWLKTMVSNLQEECLKRDDQLSERQLKLTEISAQNNLRNEEINRLKELLIETNRDNQWLQNQCNITNSIINSKDKTESNLNNKDVDPIGASAQTTKDNTSVALD